MEFDFITFNNKAVDDALQANEAKINARASVIYEKYKSKNYQLFQSGWSVIKFNNLEANAAEKAAIDIYELIDGIISSAIIRV